MLSTDKQTNRQTNQRYQKHNLLCQGEQGGKNSNKSIASDISELLSDLNGI